MTAAAIPTWPEADKGPVLSLVGGIVGHPRYPTGGNGMSDGAPQPFDPQAQAIATDAARTAGAIEAKVDRLLQAIEGDTAIGLKGIVPTLDEHATRIDKLEDSWKRVAYIAIGASLGTSGFVAILGRVFGQ